MTEEGGGDLSLAGCYESMLDNPLAYYGEFFLEDEEKKDKVARASTPVSR
jgi:hypothetical protein